MQQLGKKRAREDALNSRHNKSTVILVIIYTILTVLRERDLYIYIMDT